ncbi:MAG: helix-turn-helix domain-containing protein [Bacteroidaceae bacterium]|nr:helix-turn-helix domain-containing protein [Bacteroidaceae bacterium]
MQSQTIDSLYECAHRDGKVDIEQANRLIVALDALGCADSLYVFTNDNDEEEILCAMCLYMSYYYYDNAHYVPALKMCLMAVRNAELMDDLGIRSDCYSMLGTLFHRIGDQERAFETMRKCIQTDSILGDKSRLSSSFNNLAAIVMAMEKPEDAVRYELQAIAYEKSLPSPDRLSVRYGILSEAYLNAGKAKESMHYAQLAYDLDRKAGNQLGIARRLSQMADAYMAMEDFKQAETLYLRADELLRQIGEKNSLAINCKQLGQLYTAINKYDEAYKWLLEAEYICAETGNRYLRVNVNEQISFILKDKEPERSRIFLLYAKSLKDSIQTDKSLLMSAEYKEIFEKEEEAERHRRDSKRHAIVLSIIIAVTVILAVIVLMLLRQRNRHSSRQSSTNASTNEQQPDTDSTAASEGDAETTMDCESADVTEVMPSTMLLSPATLKLDEYDEEIRKTFLGLIDYVNANMLSGSISVEEAASSLCLSRSQLNRRINVVIGGKGGAMALINACRLEKASRLLKTTNKRINEISTECGFEDHSYFIRVFRTAYKMTPKQYRNLPEI